MSASGFVSINGSEAQATDTATVNTYVGSGATLSGGSSGSSAVFSASYSKISTEADGLAAAGFAAVGSSTAQSTYNGFTRSHLDGAMTSGGSLAITALGTALTSADATALGGGILVAANGAEADATVQQPGSGTTNVQASLGSHTISVSSDITMASLLIATASAQTHGFAASLLGSGGKALSQSSLTPDVETTIGGGNVTSSGGGISLSARYNADASGNNISGVTNTANAISEEAAASGFLSLTGSEADATDSAFVNAGVGSGATLSGGGALSLLATSYARTNTSSNGITLSIVAAAGSSNSTSTANGATRAHLDGGVTSGGSLTITSISTEKSFADASALGGGLFFAGNGSEADAYVHTGPNPSLQAALGSRNVTVDGDITIGATMFSTTQATADGVSVSLGLSAGRSEANSEITPTVNAAIGGGHVTSNNGAISVSATFDPNQTAVALADARASDFGIFFAGIAGGLGNATVSPTIDSGVGSGAVLSAGTDISVISGSNTQARSLARGVGGGLAGVGLSSANATASGSSNAHLDGSVSSGRNLTVKSQAQDGGAAQAQAVAGGLFSDQDNNATVNVKPSSLASLNGATVSISGNLEVNAVELPEGDGSTQGTSVGLIGVGGSETNIVITPTVDAHVAGSAVSVGGSVQVLASASPQSSANTPNYQIVAVDTNADTLEVDNHALQTGAVIEYHTPDGNVYVGGLITTYVDNSLGDSVTVQREYNVINVDTNHLALGDSFDAATAIDPNAETIQFQTPHNFQTGDAVAYHGDPSTGLVDGTTYYVVVLDPRTIKLTATYAQAVNPSSAVKVFNASDIESNHTTIDLGGHGFTNGQAVTYTAPSPQTFVSGQVNQNVVLSGFFGPVNPSDNPLNYNIFFFDADGNAIDPGWSDGTQVVYNVTSTDSGAPIPIGGLVNGHVYRVIRVPYFFGTSYSIELKNNDTVTASVDFVRDGGGDQIVRRSSGDFNQDGFGANQTLYVSSSGINDGTSYTIKSVSVDGKTITLNQANTFTATQITSQLQFFDQVTSCAPPTGCVIHTYHIFRQDGHNWTDNTDFGSLSSIQIVGTGGSNDGTYSIVSISGNDMVVSQAVTNQTVTATAHQPISGVQFDEPIIPLLPVTDGAATTVDFSGNTITRTDGLSWADTTFVAGASINVSNRSGSTSNDDVTASYTISSISGSTIFLTSNVSVNKSGIFVSVVPSVRRRDQRDGAVHAERRRRHDHADGRRRLGHRLPARRDDQGHERRAEQRQLHDPERQRRHAVPHELEQRPERDRRPRTSRRATTPAATSTR